MGDLEDDKFFQISTGY